MRRSDKSTRTTDSPISYFIQKALENPALISFAAGLVDEIVLQLAPVLLGAGTRLFDWSDGPPTELAPIGMIQSPSVTHLHYAVAASKGG